MQTRRQLVITLVKDSLQERPASIVHGLNRRIYSEIRLINNGIVDWKIIGAPENSFVGVQRNLNARESPRYRC
jgi:hypothetical protein